MRESSGSSSSLRKCCEQALIAGEHHGEQQVRIQARRAQQPQFVEHRRLHLLGFVDDQHRAAQRGVDVLLPALAQHLGPAPAVVRMQLHAEELAQFAVEVGACRPAAG